MSHLKAGYVPSRSKQNFISIDTCIKKERSGGDRKEERAGNRTGEREMAIKRKEERQTDRKKKEKQR